MAKTVPEPSSPLFNWLTERRSGLLVHPTSFPTTTGVGNFGPSAVHFLDFLESAGFHCWQMCPLGPTGFGDSPYQTFSVFAGNSYLIDFEALRDLGLLSDADLAPLRALPTDKVDYGGLYTALPAILDTAYKAFAKGGKSLPEYGDFDDFCKSSAEWLEPFAAFVTCKHHHDGAPWLEWPEAVRSYQRFCESALRKQLEPAMDVVRFTQFVFWAQWKQLRAAAVERHIEIIGDVPIFVALDSADVWANPAHFLLNSKTLQPEVVAGVPPDYFSATGQLWGNPLYDWDAHKADGYEWWVARMRAAFETFDIVRLDHFIGFHNYYAIPAEAKDAREGKWCAGPGLDLFAAIKKAIPEAKIIAEDLGELTDEVVALRRAAGLPGMSVLQFAFGSGADNPYLPHHHEGNMVVYPGTHDNNTTLGWYHLEAAGNVQDHFRRYFQVDGAAPQWDLLRATLRSVARLAVIPLQDPMNLGGEARLNQPGTQMGNWQWRYNDHQLNQLWENSAPYLRELNGLYGRLPR